MSEELLKALSSGDSTLTNQIHFLNEDFGKLLEEKELDLIFFRIKE